MIELKQGLITEQIEQRIKAGTYDIKLPSASSLAADFHVNVKTVHKAILKLVDRGILSRKKGQGTFISHGDDKLEDTLLEMLPVGTSSLSEFTPFFSAIWRGITDVLKDTAYRIVITPLPEDTIKSGLKHLHTDFCKSAGKFLMGTGNTQQINFMKKKKMIFVLVASKTTVPNVASVYMDTKQAFYEATSYILSKGRKKIAYIGMTAGEDFPSDIEKFHGYLEALHEHDLKPDFSLIQHAPPYADLGYVSMRKILERGIPQAVFVAYDHLCPGVYKAIKEKGFSIPDDIGVVGCDGIDLYLEPALTTIAVPRYEIGLKSAELLLSLIKSPDKKHLPSIVLKGRLLLKKSL